MIYNTIVQSYHYYTINQIITIVHTIQTIIWQPAPIRHYNTAIMPTIHSQSHDTMIHWYYYQSIPYTLQQYHIIHATTCLLRPYACIISSNLYNTSIHYIMAYKGIYNAIHQSLSRGRISIYRSQPIASHNRTNVSILMLSRLHASRLLTVCRDHPVLLLISDCLISLSIIICLICIIRSLILLYFIWSS